MPTSPPSVSTLPPAPIRGQAGFSAATGTFLEALPDWGDELDAAGQVTYDNAVEVAAAASDIAAAAAVAADAAGLRGDSTTTLAVSAGNKDITLTSAKANLLTANRQVVLILKSDATIRMFGNIAASPAPTSTTARVVVTSGGISGSGTYADWHVMDAAFFAAASTAAEMWAGVSDAAPVTPKSLADAAAFQTLTEAEVVAGWDTATKGFNTKVTLTANRVVGAPSNMQDGVTYTFQPIQGGAGSYTLSWNAIWDFGAAGAPVLSTAVGKEDKVVGQYNEARNKIEANFRRAA